MTADHVEAIMPALRALVVIDEQSVTQLEDRVTLPQPRVLVLIAGLGTANVSALTEAIGIHLPIASRSCDGAVAHLSDSDFRLSPKFASGSRECDFEPILARSHTGSLHGPSINSSASSTCLP